MKNISRLIAFLILISTNYGLLAQQNQKSEKYDTHQTYDSKLLKEDIEVLEVSVILQIVSLNPRKYLLPRLFKFVKVLNFKT